MMVMRLNVVVVAVCDATSKLRRHGVTLTYLPAVVTLTYMVSAVCCQLDVANVAVSALPSEGSLHHTTLLHILCINLRTFTMNFALNNLPQRCLFWLYHRFPKFYNNSSICSTYLLKFVICAQ